jgi:glucoamylase
MQHGPVTQQERWEEVSGFSPSTLAVVIAGLICAADMARASGGEDSAREFESCADFFEANVDLWTTTDRGTILADVPTHYVRIRPAQTGAPLPTEPVRDEQITIASRPPGTQWSFPARDIVDAGFLELVRYGIRKPTDPLIVNSLRVVDASIKVDTPFGPSWRRYTQDSYGQRDDGSAFEGYGRGRAWPLLTGERAHYELAAGGDAHSLRETLEKFAGPTGLLSEQVWDAPDLPEEHMKTGFPTGAATPLCWAHAEYIKLLRSIRDGQVFDVIPPVAARYANRP